MSSKLVTIPYERYINMKNLSLNNRKVTKDDEKDDNALYNSKESKNYEDDDNLYKERTEDESDTVEGKKYSTNENNSQNNSQNEKDNNILTNEDVINFLPKNCIKNCKLLLLHMKNNNIGWDTHGRLVIGEQCVIDTHVIDLLTDIIHKNKEKPSVHNNSLIFAQLLLSLNCPQSILNKYILKDAKTKEKN